MNAFGDTFPADSNATARTLDLMARQSLVRGELTERVIRSASKVDLGLEVDARRLGRSRNGHCDRPSELSIQPVSVFCANACFDSVYMDVRLSQGFFDKVLPHFGLDE